MMNSNSSKKSKKTIASCHGDIGLLFYHYEKVKLCPPNVYTTTIVKNS